MTTQRLWRSTCPQCGAPVELRSAATPVAVCSFCRSTLARDGDALRRMGSSAELFEDYSTLQLGASGTWRKRPFTLIGRLQWRTADASWNEWQVLFDNAAEADAESSADSALRAARGWLSEDNGRYVMAIDGAVPAELSALVPAAQHDPAAASDALLKWAPGQQHTLGGQPWSVASVVVARIAAAEGELAQLPAFDQPVTIVDLRNPRGFVATLAAGGRGLSWSTGESVALASLALTGLRDIAAQDAAMRGVTCPSCGTPLQIKLDSTKSIACHQCRAIVDVSQGVGGDLAFAKQAAARDVLAQPLIPLGSTGALLLDETRATWQVVGYLVRQELDADDVEPPWTEYLLYSRAVGFAFLVNASEGWSWAVPLTGVPVVAGSKAAWQNRSYSKRYEYDSKVSYVLGEFYWNVQRNHTTRHADYASGPRRLNREQQADEVTWSEGRTIAAPVVAAAFGVQGIADERRVALGDVRPAASGSLSPGLVVALVITLVLIMLVLRSCDRERCDQLATTYGGASVEYQQCLNRNRARASGGSWGGSSGGGHK